MNEDNRSITDLLSAEQVEQILHSGYRLSVHHVELIKFKNSNKQRAVYKVMTSGGSKCLKQVYYDKPTMLFIFSVTEWLRLNGIHCPGFLRTANGHRHLIFNDEMYVLTEWIDGRKCDYDNHGDLIQMSSNLAKIHRSSDCFKPMPGSLIHQPDGSYFRTIGPHTYQLLDLWNKSNLLQDNFTMRYKEVFDYFFNCAKESMYILNGIDFSEQFGDSLSTGAICHLDYVNKNILFDKNEQIHTIDFDNAKIEYPVHDICYFTRRIMKRSQTSWNFDIFAKLMDSYERHRQLSRVEYDIILATLLFPQKYWKLSKDYFRNRKYNKQTPYLQGIDELESSAAEHQQFVVQFRDYLKVRFS